MRINAITNVRFASQNAKGKNVLRQQPQITVPTTTQPNADTVSFKGKVVHRINTARKFIDYGDIFKPGVQLISREFSRAKGDFVNLINANLKGSNFAKSVFRNANFTNTNLVDANFKDSNLEGSLFKNVISKNSNLKYTDLRKATFEGDFGIFTDLSNSNLIGADFKKAYMTNLNLAGAIYNEYTEFPNWFNPKSKNMILFNKNMDVSYTNYFERMKLRYLNFDGANFSSAGLKRTDLKGCNFINCNMQNSILSKSYAKEAKFINTDLSKADLEKINLDKAILKNVDLRNADLSGATLTWSEATDVNLKGALYDENTVFNQGFNPKEHGMEYKIESFYGSNN